MDVHTYGYLWLQLAVLPRNPLMFSLRSVAASWKLKRTQMIGGWTPRRPAKVIGSAVAVAFLGKFKRQITQHVMH